jgi:hypothetical protein
MRYPIEHFEIVWQFFLNVNDKKPPLRAAF